ncbi:hypothetical protein H0H93_012910, partial [Arthromyces matolae]
LRLEPNDADAKQTKLFLLLQTEQYDAALTLIDLGDGQHSFEKAYSLYRLHSEEEAKTVLQEVKQEKGDADRATVHLDAQMNYREGAYDQAVELYNQLLETADPQSEEYSDILTNLQASQHHLDFITTGFLTSLDSLPNSTTGTIESTPPPTQSSSSQEAIKAASAASVALPSTSSLHKDDPQPEPKKPRKSRVPAGVIPGVTPPPDPERWLKKSERSTFGQGGGRRRKGQQGGGGATQGSSTGDLPAPASTNSGGGGGGGGGAKKGKKKK